MIAPPESEAQLLERAKALTGRPLGWVAETVGLEAPPDLRRHKGWVGQLLERALGATAGSRAEPDFPQLGIELKSIPVDQLGVPQESTFVCTAPLDDSLASHWEESWVFRKLSCVLWAPVVGVGKTPVAQRIVGPPLLWRPHEAEQRLLRDDWEELSGLIRRGEIGDINARRGEVLQLRPKAAHSRERTWMLDEEANWVQANPRGFYLRQRFTKTLMARHFSAEGGRSVPP